MQQGQNTNLKYKSILLFGAPGSGKGTQAERLCDRMAVVHPGRLVALATPERLLARLGERIVEIRVLGDPQSALTFLRHRNLAGGDAFAVGATLTVPLHDQSSRAVLDALVAAGIGTSSSATRKPTLDDVYLQLTGDRLAA